MTMENQPFEDVSPTNNGDFPVDMLVFRGVNGEGVSSRGIFETSVPRDPRPIPMELPFGQARWEVGKSATAATKQNLGGFKYSLEN